MVVGLGGGSGWWVWVVGLGGGSGWIGWFRLVGVQTPVREDSGQRPPRQPSSG